jgi:hypothetical protein
MAKRASTRRLFFLSKNLQIFGATLVRLLTHVSGDRVPVFNAVFGILFLLFFEIDLHCTQKTSFLLATFDFSPHEEEIPVPAVYRHPFAVPLRLYLGVMVGSYILLPAVGGALVTRRRITL